MIHDILWPTREVLQRGIEVNSQVPIERCQHFTEMYGTFRDFRPQSVCGSDYLACTEPTTGDQTAADLWPVVAAGR